MRLLHEDFPLHCNVFVTYNERIYSGTVIGYTDHDLVLSVPDITIVPVASKPERCIRQALTPSEERIEQLQILLHDINQHQGIITHEELGPFLQKLHDIVMKPRRVN